MALAQKNDCAAIYLRRDIAHGNGHGAGAENGEQYPPDGAQVINLVRGIRGFARVRFGGIHWISFQQHTIYSFIGTSSAVFCLNDARIST